MSDIATKLESRTLILGNILKTGSKIRVNAQLVNAETEETYKTYHVDASSENDFFILADSLSSLIKNYIEIRKLSDQYNSPEIQGNSLTNSSEAFKYYMHGIDAFKYIELQTAIEWYSKAIEADSSFIQAYVFLSFAYLLSGDNRQAKYWCETAYKKRAGLPTEEKLILDQLNAYYFETPIEEIKYLKQLIEIDRLNTLYWHQLGFAYYKLFEYEDAISNWEQVLKIHKNWGNNYENPFLYFLMGDVYHKTNDHKKEEDVLELGISLFPEAMLIIHYQTICALSQGETQKAAKLLSEYKSLRQNVLHCTEAMISSGIGNIYTAANMFDEAEDYYRTTMELEPQDLNWVNDFAWFLIDNDINVNEGMDLLETILEQYPEYWPSLDSKGWGLYKLGKYEEALKLLKDSWDLRPAYSHTGYLHIQEVEQAIAKQNSEQ
jgi:tetratricopeptide (TPR) repeat protein